MSFVDEIDPSRQQYIRQAIELTIKEIEDFGHIMDATTFVESAVAYGGSIKTTADEVEAILPEFSEQIKKLEEKGIRIR